MRTVVKKVEKYNSI